MLRIGRLSILGRARGLHPRQLTELLRSHLALQLLQLKPVVLQPHPRTHACTHTHTQGQARPSVTAHMDMVKRVATELAPHTCEYGNGWSFSSAGVHLASKPAPFSTRTPQKTPRRATRAASCTFMGHHQVDGPFDYFGSVGSQLTPTASAVVYCARQFPATALDKSNPTQTQVS